MKPVTFPESTVMDQIQMEKVAAQLAQTIQPGDTVFLYGPLGAGKSTFARALLKSLGVDGLIPSPSFIVDAVYTVENYEIHHVDLFRLAGDVEELEAYGIADLFDGNMIIVVEWAEKLPAYYRRSGIEVTIEMVQNPENRRLLLEDKRVARD